MSQAPVLPPLPPIELALKSERCDEAPPGAYLRVKRLELEARFPDGSKSEPFVYDVVVRKALDAVVVVPHYVDARGERRVVLRSALRPPVAFRPHEGRPMAERPTL